MKNSFFTFIKYSILKNIPGYDWVVLEEAQSLHQKALELHKKGKLEESIALYSKALRAIPNSSVGLNERPLVYLNRGNAKWDIKDFKGALSDYDNSIFHNPNIALAYYNRAYLKETALSDYTTACGDYEAAIMLNPDYQEAAFNYALLLLRIRKPDQALKRFKDYITKWPEEGFAYYYLAIASFIGGDTENGMKLLQISSKLACEDADKLMAQLKIDEQVWDAEKFHDFLEKRFRA